MEPIIRRWQNHFAHDDLIHCWMIVPKAVVEALETTETLTCPINLAYDESGFASAYAWLRDVMNRFGFEQPCAGITPWWRWVQRDADQPMPYIDDLEGMPPDACILEMQIPKSSLLLSCHGQWHMVLNFAYISHSDTDDADFDAQVEAQGATLFQGPYPEPLQARLEQSWLEIFELDKLYGEQGGYIHRRSVQGTFWALEKRYITGILQPGDLVPAPD